MLVSQTILELHDLCAIRANLYCVANQPSTIRSVLQVQYHYAYSPPHSKLHFSLWWYLQQAATSTATLSRSGGSQTYAAKVFEKKSNQREMSLSERKSAMLTEARLRYIELHRLSITLEQIETGRF